MSPIRSLGNKIASFRNRFGNTGFNAATPPPESLEASGGTKINYNNVNYHVFKSPAPFSAPGSFDTNINYIILGGGGGAGYSSPSGNGGPGGGGAGALIDKSSVPMSGPFNLTVTVGPGGAKASSVNTKGSDGGDSSINFPGGTLTAEGGGAGGRTDPGADAPIPSGGPGNPGGSGGGAGLYYPRTGGTASGAPFPGTPGDSPDSGWGHDGGRGGQDGIPGNPVYYAAGGGGAGGAGQAGGDGTPASGGKGGLGYLLPSNFQVPAPAMAPAPYGDPGPSGGAYWVAGGGGTGVYYDAGATSNPANAPSNKADVAARGGGAPHGGPNGRGYAGAGNGVVSSTTQTGGVGYDEYTDALANSGSGGGGGGGAGTSGGPGDGGSGGSGLVLISYSYPT